MRHILSALCILALAAPVSAQAFDAGNVLVRLRGLYISPQTSTDKLSIDVKAQQVPEVDFSYMFTSNLSTELILATNRHEVFVGGSQFGRATLLPPTLLAQYHLDATERFKPYAGAGLNYTIFYSVAVPAGFDLSRGSFGPALQAGADYNVTESAFINVDIKKIWISTDVSAAGTKVDTLHINPWIFGLGIGFRI